MLDQEQDHVAAGWNEGRDFRWIEAGRLRLEEDDRGASARIQAPDSDGPSGESERRGARQGSVSTRLSATELAGLARHLAEWFADDPADAVRQIENCATYVKIELEAWDQRARIDEEHPPYDELARALDALLAKCRRLRENGLLAGRPKKTAPRPALSSDLSLLRDGSAEKHPAYLAFCRQMRGRAYGEEPLNQAWAFFKKGWEEGDGEEGAPGHESQGG